MAKPSEIFRTYPAETESGKTLIVTGRDNIDAYRLGGKYPYRINITWDYAAAPDGMPAAEEEAALMEEANDRLLAETQRDPAAILTGIYTGDGRRDWVFYTRSLHIFQKVFNRGLEGIDRTLPLLIEAQEDAGWEEYSELRSAFPQEF